MSKSTYIVTVSQDHRDKLGVVADRLRKAGMDVPGDGELKFLGAIRGNIEPDKAEALSDIEGVAHVTRSGQVQAQ
jgi:hypothetical protein